MLCIPVFMVDTTLYELGSVFGHVCVLHVCTCRCCCNHGSGVAVYTIQCVCVCVCGHAHEHVCVVW